MQAPQAQRRLGAQRVVGRGRPAAQQQSLSLRGGRGHQRGSGGVPSRRHLGVWHLRSGFEHRLPRGCHNDEMRWPRNGAVQARVSSLGVNARDPHLLKEEGQFVTVWGQSLRVQRSVKTQTQSPSGLRRVLQPGFLRRQAAE